MKPSFPNASETFKRLNPNLFLGGVRAAEPQQSHAPPLDGAHPRQQSRTPSVDRRPRVSIIVCRRRPIDDDNLVGGCKYIRDAIAASLRLDDAHVDWEYHQIISKQTGTIVTITPH